MHEVVDTILKKEMSRREFLGMIGLGIISMIGITSVLKNLGASLNRPQSPNRHEYGESLYGGNLDSRKSPLSL